MRSSAVTLLLLVCLLSVSVSTVSCDVCNGDDWGTPGNFSFYVFQLSWPAEFCYSHSSYPGCENPTAWQQTNLTIHGLWPNYNVAQSGHYWPQCCTSQYGTNLTNAEMNPILIELQLVWPSEQDPDPSGDWSNSLWAHEWAKHGTCAGPKPTQYFQSAMNIMTMPYMDTPSVLTSNIGGTFSLSALQSYYTGGAPCTSGQPCLVGTQCTGSSGNEFLDGITTCWDLNFKQISCPAKVIVGKTDCVGPTINLDSFSSKRKPQLFKE